MEIRERMFVIAEGLSGLQNEKVFTSFEEFEASFADGQDPIPFEIRDYEGQVAYSRAYLGVELIYVPEITKEGLALLLTSRKDLVAKLGIAWAEKHNYSKS